VANEYLLAHTEQGFTREELRQLAANSIRASFLPEPEKPPGFPESTPRIKQKW
jgi:aminodeoxyfutalosine deaminase